MKRVLFVSPARAFREESEPVKANASTTGNRNGATSCGNALRPGVQPRLHPTKGLYRFYVGPFSWLLLSAILMAGKPLNAALPPLVIYDCFRSPPPVLGVLYDEHCSSRSLLIADYDVLRAGDTSPTYPPIRVVKIGKGEALLDYSGDRFKLKSNQCTVVWKGDYAAPAYADPPGATSPTLSRLLDQRVDVDLNNDDPLRVIMLLGERCNLNYCLIRFATTKQKTSLHVKDVSVRTLLPALLRPYGLSYTMTPGFGLYVYPSSTKEAVLNVNLHGGEDRFPVQDPRINAALDRPVSLSFTDAETVSAVRLILSKIGVCYAMNPKDLEGESTTIRTRGPRVHSHFTLFLAPRKLGYIEHNGAVLVLPRDRLLSIPSLPGGIALNAKAACSSLARRLLKKPHEDIVPRGSLKDLLSTVASDFSCAIETGTIEVEKMPITGGSTDSCVADLLGACLSVHGLGFVVENDFTIRVVPLDEVGRLLKETPDASPLGTYAEN